jgi:PAS domain S-box-containing protein
MKKNSDNSPKTELRRQAEAKLSERKKKAAAPSASESDTQRLLHELEVHQIELEMQNEELVQSRVEVEAGLRQYTDLYDFAPIGYFTLAHDGTIHQVNLAGASLLGVERGALINRCFGTFVSAGSRSVFNAFLEKVFGSQQKEECEVQLLKDGIIPLCVHIEAIAEDGQREACHAMVSNITERKRAEDALRESEIELRAILESTVDGILAVDKNGKTIKTNKRFADLWRIPQTLLDSKDDEALLKFVLDQLIEPEQFFRKVQKLYGSIDKDLDTLFFKDGRVYERFSVPLLLNDSSIGRVWSFRDITERKRAEEVLQEATKERENLIRELQYALEHIKTLQGFIPICANCKKIIDDKGFWNQVEGYLMAHTDAQFTHGICPECSKLLYGDLYDKALEKQNKKTM